MSDETGADGTGTERAGMITFGDLELGLRREVEVVAERFPDTDPAVVDALVREVFAEFQNDATVEAHLLAVTRNEAIHRLEAQGEPFVPASLSDTGDQDGPDARAAEAEADEAEAARRKA